jgi:hypothetical protein
VPQQIDYDALAKQAGGQAVDYDAIAAEVSQVAAPSQPAGGTSFVDIAASGIKGVVDGLNPLPLLKSLYDDASGEFTKAQQAEARGDVAGVLGHTIAGSPIGVATKLLGRIGGAQLDQFKKAKAAYDQGRLSEAVGYTAAGVAPLVGPMAATAGEEIGTGDPTTMAHGVGLGASVFAPAAVSKLPSKVRIPGTGMFANPNPTEVAAIRYAERAGIPVDAATAAASENKVIRGAQAIADRSLGGALTGQRAARAQAEALARESGALETRAFPTATSPETAGAGVRGAVGQKVSELHGQATKAYGELADIERQTARPVQVGTREVMQTVEREVPPPAPKSFAKPDATAGQLFVEVLEDAKQQGYTGTPGELRRHFDEAVKDAKEFAGETEGSPQELLRAIAKNGGVGMDKGMPGEIRQLFENRVVPGKGERANIGNVRGGVIGGVGRVLRRDGKTLDAMAEALREDGFDIAGPRELLDAIDNARVAASRPKGGKPLGTTLEAIGVRPGTRWWEVDTSFDVPKIERTEVKTTEPVYETMGMPIDLTAARTALKPLYRRMLRESKLVPLMGDKARALTALDRLMRGEKIVPASVADGALSDLKAMSRFEGMPELRPEGKGAAAQAVKVLEEQVQQAVAQGGPAATAARTLGRQATREKYEVGDILDDLKTEPVRAYRQATLPADQNIGYLRQLRRVAPGEMPKVGRAYLSSLFEQATAEGGFGRSQKLAAEWQKLGPETKQVLFPDKALRKDLDHFFLIAKKISENPNPSGTALVGWLPAQAALALFNPLKGIPLVLGTAALSKLLHSRAGVRALTEAVEIPLGAARSRAAAGLRASRVASLAGVRPRPAVPVLATDESERR